MPRKKKEGIYERKGSSYWWASFTDGAGNRVRKSTGVPLERKEDAEAVLTKWKLEIHQERIWGVQVETSYTFDEVVLAYIKGHKVRDKQDRRKTALRQLYPFFSGKRMSSITDISVKEYIRQRLLVVGPATINREVGVFCAACNYCKHELGWDVNNPAAGKKLKEPEGRVRWLSMDEAQSVIDIARENDRAPWLADFIQLCLFTGMRKSEATGLCWSQIDFDRRLLVLETGTTKSGKRRSVPLHAQAIDALSNRLAWRNNNCPSSPWVFCNWKGIRVADMKKSFRTAMKKAGIDDFRQHDQRHTLASWMVMSGTELIKVRDMLGHSSVEQTQRYAHLHPDALRTAVDNLVPAQNSHTRENANRRMQNKNGVSIRLH